MGLGRSFIEGSHTIKNTASANTYGVSVIIFFFVFGVKHVKRVCAYFLSRPGAYSSGVPYGTTLRAGS